jgi:hypothetical protein
MASSSVPAASIGRGMVVGSLFMLAMLSFFSVFSISMAFLGFLTGAEELGR